MQPMKNWKQTHIVLFVALCVCLNVGGKLLSFNLELPMWADSFGTVLCAYIAGPICGAMVGLTGNIIYGAIDNTSVAYSITSIALAFIVSYAARNNWFDRFYGFMKAATLAFLTALIVSVPLNFILAEGFTGNRWGDGVINYLTDREWPFSVCAILGQLVLEFADKVLTIAAVYLVIGIRRHYEGRNDHNTNNKNIAEAAALLIGLSVLGSMLVPGEAVAADNRNATDYNDYVQTVYSSNNGLPCGEANDIAQTNDGVLWIGTYAGLYRYNGREFRWVDDYESVKNVNCLYVDEEGRLWIGTNDNGLSIVIREEVVMFSIIPAACRPIPSDA